MWLSYTLDFIWTKKGHLESSQQGPIQYQIPSQVVWRKCMRLCQTVFGRTTNTWINDGSRRLAFIGLSSLLWRRSCTKPCADWSKPPPLTLLVHPSQSEPKTEGWHTSLGEVFLWVFSTQSIVTRYFTKQLNHESKMVWKWGTSGEEEEDKEDKVTGCLERRGDGKQSSGTMY